MRSITRLSATRMACTIFAISCLQNAVAQSVGIGTATPNPSARLEVNSTTQGILIPSLSTMQRNAIAHPAEGLLVYQTDGSKGFYYYNGSVWINLTNGSRPNGEGIAVSTSYGLTSTLAGSGAVGSANGFGTAASFNAPYGICTDASGNIYVADRFNHKIRKVTAAGVVTTLAGRGSPGDVDATGTAAAFVAPSDVAADAAGNVYVADANNNKIRKITPAGVVSTISGGFLLPFGVAVDASGNIYVAEKIGNKISKITATGVVTILAGSGAPGSADGVGSAASFNSPTDVAVDASGNVYVADQDNYKIRKITAGGVVTTIAGSGTAGFADGIGAAASFNIPTGVVVDASGIIYVADEFNNRVRRITPSGEVTTIAGSGSSGANNGPGAAATFSNPLGIAVDASGNLFVSERIGNRIRKIIAQ